MIFDKEIEILEECFKQDLEDVLILSDNYNEDETSYIESVKIYEMITNINGWIDNSINTNNPPDIINNELEMFFEVMRFDDHSANGKDNLNRARGTKLQKEILKIMPQIKEEKIFVNAVTELSTNKDHSYEKYLDGFKRTIKKHLSKLPTYAKNCPGYKKGFLIFDESSGIYYQLIDRNREDELEHRTGALGVPHWFFIDKSFVDVFINSDLDYLIWFAPYKIDTNHLELKMPKVVFYDLKRFKCNDKLIEYAEQKMISSEE